MMGTFHFLIPSKVPTYGTLHFKDLVLSTIPYGNKDLVLPGLIIAASLSPPPLASPPPTDFANSTNNSDPPPLCDYHSSLGILSLGLHSTNNNNMHRSSCVTKNACRQYIIQVFATRWYFLIVGACTLAWCASFP